MRNRYNMAKSSSYKVLESLRLPKILVSVLLFNTAICNEDDLILENGSQLSCLQRSSNGGLHRQVSMINLPKVC